MIEPEREGRCPNCGRIWRVLGRFGDYYCPDCNVLTVLLPLPLSTGTPTVSLLDQAKRLTSHDRNKAYGHPKEDFARIAAHWGAILGVVVTPKQVALCMIAVKIARECHSTKLDNWVDMAGYARCGAAVEGLEEL